MASWSRMGSIQAWPVHERWIQYQAGQSIYNGIIIHNPNLGLLLTAGQLVKNGFHTGLASPSIMGTIASLASPFTMELLCIWPVIQQTGQSIYNGNLPQTGQSIYNGIITHPADHIDHIIGLLTY